MLKKIHKSVDGIKIYYYYLRDEKRTPYGCVCIGIDEDHKFSRGVSLCSDQDNFIKVRARNIARKRCIHAVKTRKHSLFINYGFPKTNNTFKIKGSVELLLTANHQLPAPQYLFLYKSDYDIECTPFEQEIVKEKEVTK